MTLPEALNDPKVQALLVALGAGCFSTVHTFLDKHPRLQAALKIAAHFVGPLNLPALKREFVDFCRTVIAYEDGRCIVPNGYLTAKVVEDIETVMHARDMVAAEMAGPPPIPQPEPKPAPGTVKEWPKE